MAFSAAFTFAVGGTWAPRASDGPLRWSRGLGGLARSSLGEVLGGESVVGARVSTFGPLERLRAFVAHDETRCRPQASLRGMLATDGRWPRSGEKRKSGSSLSGMRVGKMESGAGVRHGTSP